MVNDVCLWEEVVGCIFEVLVNEMVDLMVLVGGGKGI